MPNRKLGSYFAKPTFLCLVGQGLFGAIPWNAFNYLTMYFQVNGLSDTESAGLSTMFQLACAIGNVLGGLIGDAMAKRCPNHGRAFTANMSVSFGIPCVFFIFMTTNQTFAYYAILLVTWSCCFWGRSFSSFSIRVIFLLTKNANHGSHDFFPHQLNPSTETIPAFPPDLSLLGPHGLDGHLVLCGRELAHLVGDRGSPKSKRHHGLGERHGRRHRLVPGQRRGGLPGAKPLWLQPGR